MRYTNITPISLYSCFPLFLIVMYSRSIKGTSHWYTLIIITLYMMSCLWKAIIRQVITYIFIASVILIFFVIISDSFHIFLWIWHHPDLFSYLIELSPNHLLCAVTASILHNICYWPNNNLDDTVLYSYFLNTGRKEWKCVFIKYVCVCIIYMCSLFFQVDCN